MNYTEELLSTLTEIEAITLTLQVLPLLPNSPVLPLDIPVEHTYFSLLNTIAKDQESRIREWIEYNGASYSNACTWLRVLGDYKHICRISLVKYHKALREKHYE